MDVVGTLNILKPWVGTQLNIADPWLQGRP